MHPPPSRKVWPPLRVAPDLCCSDTCCMCAAVLVAALMLISAALDLCCGYSCRIIAAVLLQAKAGLTMSQHCNVEVEKKSANKCRWQRRRDRPRPSRPLRVRRWQAAIALLSALARSHDPPHSSSNRIFAPRCQPHGTPLTCCTDMLPHTPTPTNTPLGDGTSLNWMPLRAASA